MARWVHRRREPLANHEDAGAVEVFDQLMLVGEVFKHLSLDNLARERAGGASVVACNKLKKAMRLAPPQNGDLSAIRRSQGVDLADVETHGDTTASGINNERSPGLYFAKQLAGHIDPGNFISTPYS